MLDVKQATKVFSAGTASEHHALNGLNLHLDDGEFVTIIGSNGAGKSTLFNAICGNYWLDQGQIFLDGQDITFLSEHRRARQIGRVFQDPMKGTAPHLTIEESHFEVRSANRKRIYSGQSLRSTIWIWKTV